jgi:WbqC-like protein family
MKIRESDLFIILDTVAFQKNGLHNRNKIKTAQGAHWLTVPVNQRLGQKLLDVQINHNSDWRRKHWQTLQQNYQKAAAFSLYERELFQIYADNWVRLNELNISLTLLLMRWMGITTPIIRSNELKASGAGSDLILNLCLEVGATQYISGSGGRNYINSSAFENSGVQVLYREPIVPNDYPQLHLQTGFVNNLSVIDLLFNCGDEWANYIPTDGGVE